MPNGSGVRQGLRRQVMRDSGYRCAHCGITGEERRWPCGRFGFYTDTPNVFLSIDHIVPKSRGGSHDPSNLRVLCTPCNTKKGVRPEVHHGL